MTDTFPGDESNAFLQKGAERLGEMGNPSPGQTAQQAPPDEGAQFANRAEDLLSALDVMEDSGILMLPELSAKASKAITVRVKRLSVQELLAADLVPKRAITIAGFMIEQAEQRVASVRKKWNLPDHVAPTPEQMQSDKWTEEQILEGASKYIGGPPKDARASAISGFYSFMAAAVCASVMEPKMYYTQEQLDDAKRNGHEGVLVWRIPENDLWHIFNWALTTEARAVSAQVDPFPQTVNAPASAQPRQGVPPESGRADRV